MKKFLYPAIQIRYLCREYKRAKKYFFNNFDEELYNEIAKIENENHDIKKSNLLLHDENEKQIVSIQELERENKRLKQNIIDNEKNKTELIALREFMFSLDKQREHEINKNIDYNKLNSLKTIFIGGHDNLHVKLKELLPTWVYISPSNLKFDEKVLINADKIYYYADFNSHGMYYKVMSIVNKNELKLQYIEGNTNIDLILKQL
ncbi:hypothetical protein [Clostridium estertheticum]|uniref:hypothetical protein n=1 Tax=Clostridium estertheticum TaxID=238834 RepID=UPI001C0E306A|nr:hypothetical protein [Clostridium estertheticum]MBU3173375.1 hypothetical protein [Clostridium estertheticum]